ncbi:hypothetical protein O6H91_22G008100 [Diphasiastrum complanatum]|uniref:Uncharacterized protein n=1 Tax=Diphasiastrum complanatum TaxID=34168 RepID=A0ACC2ACL1_DIPCM|nr:hypothetical protein O6H91_22G008100 [Diphasiastrum complanatum]
MAGASVASGATVAVARMRPPLQRSLRTVACAENQSSSTSVMDSGDPSSSSSSSSKLKITVPIDDTSKGESSSFSARGSSVARRFYIRGDKLWDIAGSSLALAFRLGTGLAVQGYKVSLIPEAEIPNNRYSFIQVAGRKLIESSNLGPRPERPIEIYEFEGGETFLATSSSLLNRCPFCRKVREIVSVLDLDVLYYPCPKGGPNFRPKAIQLGGKKQFPYMVDPNTGVSMYESDDIIKYLVDKYGDGKVPLMLSLGFFTTLTAGLAMIGRAGKGSTYKKSRLPEKPLELWAYEPSPYCKIVREVLVELELPHLYHSTARGSPKRDQLVQRTGIFQAPYLEDPNTGIKMFESAEIIDYLRNTYALA